VYPDQALAAAETAERELANSLHRGPLHGVPVALKDLFAVAGMKRTCGSGTWDGEICAGDSTAAARLRQAGAVILGMLNLHEFAFGATGINNWASTARNPWDTDRSCGGSSSGAGCAVAARLAAAALGTDTGGSIRIPAAVCGVVGLKQSYGLASRYGIFPLCRAFDHGGPLTRSAQSAAMVLDAIAGADQQDPSTAGAPRLSFSGPWPENLNGVRIGLPDRWFFDDLHPEVEAAVKAALDMMNNLGAEIETFAVPFDVKAARQAWNIICISEAWALHAERIGERGADMAPDVRERMEAGARYSAQDIVRARWQREDIRRAVDGLMAQYHLLAMPSAPIPAVYAANGLLEHEDETWDGVFVLGRFTRLASLTGLPAVSVPCGFTGDGLPVGLQLLGRRFADADLLRAAHAYEQAAPWRNRRPPVLP